MLYNSSQPNIEIGYPSKINHQKPLKWIDLVNNMQSANQNQLNNYQITQKRRKDAYRHGLDQQIYQKNSQYYSQKKQNQQIRSQLQKNLIQYNHQQINKKQQKKLFQKSYNQENKKLIYKIQTDRIKHIQQNAHNQQQSPFFKLIDFDQQRKKTLKEKFRHQNYLNNIQTRIKNDFLQRQKKIQNQVTQNFKNHVQRQYLTRQQNRKKFLNRYINIKNQSILNAQKQYRDYLDQQVQASRNRRTRQKQLIDQIIKPFNQSHIVDSSPAFLGRIPYQHDRQTQLKYIDKNLGIFKNTQQINYQKQKHFNRHQRTKTDYDKINLNYQKYINENYDKLEVSSIPVFPSLAKQQKILLGNQKLIKNNDNKIKLYSQQSKGKQKNKEFLQYDFITGQEKRIYL